ncbi:MAG: hypothetical protein QGF74_00660 [Candidatus Nanoarchaeia archaeon]|nr:hypothetical protein [Candidatus Nanoarchaeia archaeon]|tara:strand:+ start:3843 stop:5960 length:2118 start_codon:yes stop_codon:yes gene_type:complete
MKGWIFLFIILSSVLVSAQEISILGQNYSIIVLLPLVLILMGILFFLFIYIRDNLPNIKGIFPKKKIGIKKKKKEEIFIDYRKEFDSFKSRTKKLDVNEKFNQFSGLSKDFFSYTFDINRQFTHEELENHIKKGKEVIIPFSQEIEDIKYNKEEISKKDLNKLINNFELIVKKYSKRKKLEYGFFDKIIDIINVTRIFRAIRRDMFTRARTEYVTNKRRIFERLRILKPKTKITIPKLKVNKKRIEIKEKEIEIKESPTIFEIISSKAQERKLSSLIKSCDKFINSNPEKSREIYSKLMILYYKMPIEYEEKFAHELSDLNHKIENSTQIKEERELNQLTKRMVDIVTSKEKSVVIHDKIPFFKNKVDDLIQELKLLELKGIKELRGTKKYFTDEFIGFLYRIKNLEKREIKLFKKRKEESVDRVGSKIISGRDRLIQIMNNVKNLEKREIKLFKKRKVNIMDELNNLINNLKKAEKKNIKVIRDHENDFIDGAKEVLHKIKGLEHKEYLFLRKKEKRLSEAIKDLLKNIKLEEKRRIVEVESKEREILDSIHKMMKPKIKVEPKIKPPKPLEILEVKPIEPKPKIKMPKILPPEIREYDVESFERVEPKITRMPKKESKIKVDFPKLTKDFKDLDKQEKELFKKLIKVENEPRYIEHKHRVLKVTKKKEIHAPELYVKRLRSNRKIKGLNKEEKDLYKKLIEVS